jgi:serine-type D-Ala-D-Ala carboxypeptidase/endopeptidase (penicillin-binding protein 4)
MLLAFALQSVLATPIEAVINPLIADGTLAGIYVAKLDGTVVYEKNSGQRMIPASNQKILSAAFALNTLGPDFRFKTRFWKQPNGVLVDAPGDPSLTYTQLADVRKALGRAEVVQVKQAFSPGIPPTWEYDDLPNRYAAQITSFSVDQNGFELWSVNKKPVFKPTSYGVRIIRQEGPTLRVDYDPILKIVRLTGPLPEKDGILDTLAIPQPDASAASILGAIPAKFTGTLPTTDPSVTIESKPLLEIAKICLDRSDNMMAESFMLIAASKESELGERSYPVAATRMKKFLTDTVGVPANEVRVVDGSGMSRQNFVTPRALAKTLAWGRQKLGDVWMDALVDPGKGTLGSRLSGSTFRGKTGTLTGVCSLSGFVKSQDGQDLVISLVFNYYLSPASEIRAKQDEIVRIIESTPIGTGIDGHERHREVLFSLSRNHALDGHWIR